MPAMKRTVKDSVFTFLFRQPFYTRLLYLALHPEDVGVAEKGGCCYHEYAVQSERDHGDP